MKKVFDWIYNHYYELCIFFAGADLTDCMRQYEKGRYWVAAMYGSLSVMFLINAKMEKKNRGK